MEKGPASHNQEDDEQKRPKGDSQEPDVVPPDLESAKQKARERGGWVMEAILKGAVSGTVREALQEGLDRLGF